jgi:hypothetical protein
MTTPVEQLSALFSDYRSEWSPAVFGDLFIAPPYFRKLEIPSPCFLIGGRGTGKTTALRSLRFDATAARLSSDSIPDDTLPYFGIYIRINKNRVRAFRGSELALDAWDKAFAHYFNLLCLGELCRLTAWLQERDPHLQVDLSAPAAALGLAATRHDDLLRAVNSSLIALEVFVNNPLKAERPLLSPAEAPLRYFVDALRAAPSVGQRLILCCIDEYENLLDNQQAVLNTYIKHAEPPLSYKIGVRRGGLRCRATIDSQDVLSTPDDYSEIDIGQEGFDVFARQVVEHRLQRAQERGIAVAETVEDFLPELALSSEAELLGCARIAEEVLDAVVATKDAALIKWAKRVPANELYFVKYWAEADKGNIADLARDWKNDSDTWTTRLGNYGYASLFWLSKGRKGARIRKHYSGFRTFLGLASGNIRYFIELIDESLNQLPADAQAVAKWQGSIGQEFQTLAARTVGKRRLDQLEGLSEHGSDIKRLVLTLGKVFFEFARDPVGKTPERNSFIVTGSAGARDRLLSLLYEGVSTLAFEATPRTKATTQSEARDDEFRLHPIFSPFFEYSHRRKRRCSFSADVLLDAIANPGRAIAAIIGRAPTGATELPNQLAIFSGFYDAGEGGE